jgi:hypothetical protein
LHANNVFSYLVEQALDFICVYKWLAISSRGRTSSHFLKPLFAFLEVRAKGGLSHMMMVHTQATSLKPLFHFSALAQHFRYCAHFSTLAKQALAAGYGLTRSQTRGTIMFNLNQTMIKYAKINKIVSCVLQILSNIITHK